VEEEANPPKIFTSLLNKAALRVRLISNMFRFCAFFVVVVLSVYFQIIFSSLLPVFLLYGWESVPGNNNNKNKKRRKKERKNWEKRGVDKKKKEEKNPLLIF